MTTKFDIEDRVWIIYNNEGYNGTITAIDITKHRTKYFIDCKTWVMEDKIKKDFDNLIDLL